MPLYEFQCVDCEVVYEELAPYDESGQYEGITCPECGSPKKEKQLSVAKHNFTNPEGTDRMNDHDYRYHHSVNKPGGAKDQRKMAESVSDVGPSPYNPIDDVSSGDHFGDVK